jgi:hypothetical protein
MKYFKATLKNGLNPLITLPTGRQVQLGMIEQGSLRKSYQAEDLNF